MRFFPWIKPLQLRHAEEGHRQASWLELFADLAFVLAIGQLTALFQGSISEQDLLQYSFLFFLIFWVWNRFTWYASHYDNDDVLHRIGFMGIIFCVVGLTAALPRLEARHPYFFACFYTAIQALMTAFWFRAWQVSLHRSHALYFLLSTAMATLLAAASLYFIDYYAELWAVGIGIELIGSLLAWRRADNPIELHTDHIIERYGLFMIILLGEGLAGIRNIISFPLTAQHLFMLACTFGIIVLLWWIYFDWGYGYATDLSRRMFRTFIFGYGQFFVYFATAVICVCLQIGLEQVLEQKNPEQKNQVSPTMLLLGGCSLFLISISLVQLVISRHSNVLVYGFRLGVGVLFGGLAAALPGLSFAYTLYSLLAGLGLVAANDTLHWGRYARRRRRAGHEDA